MPRLRSASLDARFSYSRIVDASVTTPWRRPACVSYTQRTHAFNLRRMDRYRTEYGDKNVSAIARRPPAAIVHFLPSIHVVHAKISASDTASRTARIHSMG